MLRLQLLLLLLRPVAMPRGSRTLLQTLLLPQPLFLFSGFPAFVSSSRSWGCSWPAEESYGLPLRPVL